MWSDHTRPPSLVPAPLPPPAMSLSLSDPPLLSPAPPPKGYYFPSRIALLVSVLLVVSGAASVVAGILAVVFSAAESHCAAGVAAGVVAGIAGALGMSAGRRRRDNGSNVIAGFMAAVVAAAGAAGVLIYFSVTGWREDREAPPSFYFDEAGKKVDFLGTTNFRHIAVVVNLTLVGLGSVIGLLSVVGIIICIREVCDCCRPSYSSSSSTGFSDIKVIAGPYPATAGYPSPPPPPPSGGGWFDPSDRLSRWLHHQYMPQWVRPKQWNGQPFTPLFHTMASNSYSSGSYSSDAASRQYGQVDNAQRFKDPRRIQKEEKRRRRAKQKKKELRELKNQRKQEEKTRAVTEEEVNSTYTGLDREMAEEFISVSMEPGRTINRVMNHSDDNSSPTSLERDDFQ